MYFLIYSTVHICNTFYSSIPVLKFLAYITLAHRAGPGFSDKKLDRFDTWSISPGAVGSNPALRVKVFFFADSCSLGVGLQFSGG